MNLSEKLNQCKTDKKALLATNFYNFETLRGILEAVKELGTSIILQLTNGSIKYMGLENALSMARSAIQSYGIEGFVHLDHSSTIELTERCLKAGFDSVMYDGSELPLEENIANTKKVVQMAKQYGANVEAELGYVAKLGQSTDKVGFTEPSQARKFVEETGVNALAVAIGTAHGFYKQEPRLDFERLVSINKVANACLVLHGGSGVPDESIKKAVKLGICKVNLATEIKNTFMKSLQQLLINNKEIDLRKVFPPAIDDVKRLVMHKLEIVSRSYA